MYILFTPGGRTYVGCTNNLYKRLQQHNGALAGGAAATRAHQPGQWQLAAIATGLRSRQLALQLEHAVQHPTTTAWLRQHVRHRTLTRLHRPGITNRIHTLHTLFHALQRRYHLRGADIGLHILGGVAHDLVGTSTTGIRTTTGPITVLLGAPPANPPNNNRDPNALARVDAALAAIAKEPVRPTTYDDLTAAIKAWAPAKPATCGPPAHRASRQPRPLGRAEAIQLFTSNRRQLHRRLDPAPSTPCPIPAADLAAHHRREAAAEPNLPHASAALANLPPRAPFGLYASDAALTALITPAEVERHIRGSKRHTAAGNDGIASETLRDLADHSPEDPPRPLVDALVALYNHLANTASSPAAWHSAAAVLLLKPGKPAALPASWRHICLPDALYKAYSSILASRLTIYLGQPLRLHPNQHGFVPDAGCLPHALTVRLRIEKAQRERGDLTMVFIDITNAFGTVAHEALLSALAVYSVPAATLAIIRDAYQGISMRLPDGDIVELGRGVKQGDPLAPILFAAAIDPALHAASTADQDGSQLAYADDLTLSSDSAAGAQRQLEAVQDHLGATGQHVNTKKTVVLHIAQGRVCAPAQPITAGTTPLRHLQDGDTHTYLGHRIKVDNGRAHFREAADDGLAELQRRLGLVSTCTLPPLAAISTIRSWALPAATFAATVADVNMGGLDEADNHIIRTARALLPSSAGGPLASFAPNAFLVSPTRDGGLAVPVLREHHTIERASLLLSALAPSGPARTATLRAVSSRDYTDRNGGGRLWDWLATALRRLDMILYNRRPVSWLAYTHSRTASAYTTAARALPANAIVCVVRQQAGTVGTVAFLLRAGGPTPRHRHTETSDMAGSDSPIDRIRVAVTASAALRAQHATLPLVVITQAAKPLPLLPWSPTGSAARSLPDLLDALRDAADPILAANPQHAAVLVLTCTTPIEGRFGWLDQPGDAVDADAPWPHLRPQPSAPICPQGPPAPFTAGQALRLAVSRQRDLAWLRLDLDRYAATTHAVSRRISPGVWRQLLLPATLARSHVQVAFDAVPVFATVRRRMQLLPAPTSMACPFGCGPEDTMAHCLQACRNYSNAHVARHDHVVRRLAATLTANVEDLTNLTTNTSADPRPALPAWLIALLGPTGVPPAHLNTRPDIWASTGTGLAAIEVAVTADRPDAQADTSRTKRTTYGPMMDHLREHLNVPVRLFVVVVGVRGIIAPAALLAFSSALEHLGLPPARARAHATSTLRAISTLCAERAQELVYMRTKHPVHGLPLSPHHEAGRSR